MSEIETNATVPTPEETAEQPERTFTQTELDAIVSDRLKRERAKYADYEDLKARAEAIDTGKSELQKATERADALQKKLDQMLEADKVRQIRDKISQETGVPAGLLSGDTEEACAEQAAAILAFAKPTGYPKVKDAGEITHTGGGKTREQFKDWYEANIIH